MTEHWSKYPRFSKEWEAAVAADPNILEEDVRVEPETAGVEVAVEGGNVIALTIYTGTERYTIGLTVEGGHSLVDHLQQAMRYIRNPEEYSKPE